MKSSTWKFLTVGLLLLLSLSGCSIGTQTSPGQSANPTVVPATVTGVAQANTPAAAVPTNTAAAAAPTNTAASAAPTATKATAAATATTAAIPSTPTSQPATPTAVSSQASTPTATTQSGGGTNPPGTASLPATFSTLLVGTLGDKYDIHMKVTRNADKLLGQYFYEQVRETTGYEQYLYLDGTIDNTGNAVLNERDTENKQTGTFKGTIASNGTILKYTGTWTNGDGTQSLPFSLSQQQFNLGTGLKLGTKVITEDNKQGKYNIEVHYPVIEGASSQSIDPFNQEVNTMIQKEIDSFKQSVAKFSQSANPPPASLPGSSLKIDYVITLGQDGLLSVQYTESTYFTGAAHPNSVTLVTNYDLNKGKVLALADLFKSGSNYLQTLSDYSLNVLKQHVQIIEAEGAAPKADNYSRWNLDEKGLIITFDPYQVAAYVYGPQRIFVPYSQLKSIINPDGPLAPLVK